MARLGDHVRIKTGKLDANASSDNGQYPFFTCAVKPLKIDTYSYDCECVLVAGNGDLNVKYYQGKFDAYQRTYIIESLDKAVLTVPYLYCFLDKYVETLRQQAIGGVIKYIKLGNLTEAEIPIPSLAEQENIVRNVHKVNEMIALRKEQLAKLDQLVKSRFIELFGDPECNPHGWPCKLLGQLVVVEPQNGVYKPQTDYVQDGSGIPILRIDAFYDGKVTNFRKLKRLNCTETEKQRYLLREHDIVINRVNSIEYLGKCAHICNMVEDTVFESNMMRFHLDESVMDAVYATRLLCSQYIYKQILRKAKKAVNQASINQGDVMSFELLVPPLSIQKQFATFIEQTDKSKMAVQQSLDKLETLKKSLMQEYFG